MELDLPVKTFRSVKDWEKWLSKNYTSPSGIWVKFYKKASGVKSIVYAEALDVALCYGWIDAQLKRFDEQAYLQRFTPRRKRSMWSKRNIEHIDRLKKLGRMKPAGLAAVAEAKKNGQWANAYHSQSNAVMPDDFLVALAKNKKAQKFYETLSKSNLYAIWFRIHSVKRPENRIKKIKSIIAMLSRGEKIHLI